MRARNKKLFAVVETAYNTPGSITGANACRTTGIQILRYAGDRVTQEYDRAGLGNFRQINANPHAGFSQFSVPFIGSGDVGVAPAWAPLVQACATAETDDTAVNDEWYYTPVDTGFASLTCVVAEELVQQQSTGVRGNFGIEANPGTLPVLTFSNFLGAYERPVPLALTNVDDSAFQNAIPVTYSNTTVLTVGGKSYPVSGFTFDAGVTVTRVSQPNREETIVEDRRASGSIIVSPAQAADIIELFQVVENHVGATDVAIQLKH
ncbi:MAG: hypothetical protein LBE21_04855, partial [Pseudomonadales bacterium]|nr:hypothetical protein [Pseudomonadales bacterium]